MNIGTPENISQLIFTTSLMVICFIIFLAATYFTETPSIKSLFGLMTILFLGLSVWGIFIAQSAYFSEPVTEKTFTSFTIKDGANDTVTITGVGSDSRKSEFIFNSKLNLIKRSKTNGNLELELLEKDDDGNETVPTPLTVQDYDTLRNEIINSSNFGEKYIVTYQKKRVVYKTNWEFILQLLKGKRIPENDTGEFITLKIKPKISVESK